MGIRESIESILGQIRTVEVTNNDGQIVSIYTRVWNNQTELKKQGATYSYPTPAAFVEWQFGQGIPIGQGATAYDVTFRVMIEHQQLDAGDGTYEQDLDFTDIVNSIHRALNRFKPANCSHLQRVGVQLDYAHDNTYLCVVEYASHFVDLVASDEDTYIVTTQTIESPILEIEESIYQGIVPDDGSGVSPTIVNGSIVPGYGLGPTIWYSDNGVPSPTLGKNSDFYLDNLTGNIYKKVAGVWVYQMKIKGASATGTSQVFTSTSGQSTYVVTGGYTVGGLDVYFNGVRLIPAEFTATNGASVILGVAAQLDDIVEIIKYS